MIFTDQQLIELLGGPSKVARLCKVSPAAVSLWMHRGIPALQLMFMAASLEEQSHGLVTRKDLFPNTYGIMWPELKEVEKEE